MRKRFFFVAIVGMATLASSGCSNSRSASSQNFLAAIRGNVALSDQRQCTTAISLPMKFSEKMGSPFFRYGVTNDLPKYDSLVQVGLLRREVSDVPHPAQFFQPAWTDHVVQYAITKDGAEYERKEKASNPFADSDTDAAFCYGSVTPEKVTNFTEPGQFNGVTVSKVQYTYAFERPVPDWAKNPAVQRNFPEIEDELLGEHRREETATVMLTNNGWEASQ